jgi:hypothetical protein
MPVPLLPRLPLVHQQLQAVDRDRLFKPVVEIGEKHGLAFMLRFALRFEFSIERGNGLLLVHDEKVRGGRRTELKLHSRVV